MTHSGKPAATAESAGCFVARRRVEFRDTDAAGIAHFSAFFVWMESAEHELMRESGIDLVERVGGGETISWPRVSAACDYLSAVRFNDELEIGVGVEAIGRTSVTWGFRFRCAGRDVARGRVVSVRCRIRPEVAPEAVPIPDAIRDRLARRLLPAADPSSAG